MHAGANAPIGQWPFFLQYFVGASFRAPFSTSSLKISHKLFEHSAILIRSLAFIILILLRTPWLSIYERSQTPD